jgi:hypothetical protein
MHDFFLTKGDFMQTSQFIQSFVQKAYAMAGEESERHLVKQERVVRNNLFVSLGGHGILTAESAAKYQETFHTKMDQLASDFRTWKKAGCKQYARPKQIVSGPIAYISKKAFDQALNDFLITQKKSLRMESQIDQEDYDSSIFLRQPFSDKN